MEPVRTLLIGNFQPDKQESMLRFAKTLHDGLNENGWPTKLIHPMPILSKSCKSNQGLGKWLGYVDKIFLFPIRLRKYIKKLNPDIVHICDHSNAFYIPPVATRPHLITCNDLIAIRSAQGEFSEYPTRFSGKILQHIILSGLKQAKRFACISQNTKDNLIRITGAPETSADVVYMGQNFNYQPINFNEAIIKVRNLLNNPSFDKPYLIHVGHNGWYKNKLGVLYLYKKLKDSLETPLDLILIGPSIPEDQTTWIKKHNLNHCVHFLSDINNRDLQALYSCAELLLFPSLIEGFGWPIIEAQACGCRVVTTEIPPMTELGADTVCYIPPPEYTEQKGLDKWSDEVTPTIYNYFQTPKEVKVKQREKGIANTQRFKTNDMVMSYINIYEKILAT